MMIKCRKLMKGIWAVASSFEASPAVTQPLKNSRAASYSWRVSPAVTQPMKTPEHPRNLSCLPVFTGGVTHATEAEDGHSTGCCLLSSRERKILHKTMSSHRCLNPGEKNVQKENSFALLLCYFSKIAHLDGQHKKSRKGSIAVYDYCFTVSLIPNSQDLNIDRKHSSAHHHFHPQRFLDLLISSSEVCPSIPSWFVFLTL